MSLASATFENAARQRFDTVVVAKNDLAVEYPNAKFKVPDNKLWMRWTFIPGEQQQASIGSAKTYRTPGVMIVQIFVPRDTGTALVRQWTNTIENAFLSVSAGGIQWKTPHVEVIGNRGGWWQTNVVCPFYFDQLS